MSLVTLEQVKTNMHLTQDDHDDRLNMLIRQASAIVLDYLKLPAGSYQTSQGDPDGVPTIFEYAVLLQVETMFDMDSQNQAPIISQNVIDLLMRSRDPALA